MDPVANGSTCPRASGRLIRAGGCALKYGFGNPVPNMANGSNTNGYTSYHPGLDIDDQPGDANPPVLAVGSGDIIACGWMGPGGNTVVIRHDNGITTAYLHLARLYC